MDFTFFPATTTLTPGAAVPSSGPASSSLAPAEQPSPATGVIMAEDQDPRPPEEKSTGPGPGPGGGDAAAKAAATAEVEDRMDQLWEDFNEELGQLARARRRPRGGGSCRREREHRGDDGLPVLEGGRRTRSEPSPPSWSSDADSEPAARAAGCAPVLRPSARAAGGARHCRRRAGTWVLLMRIFRRLFVIEKTISAAAVASRQRSSSSTRAR